MALMHQALRPLIFGLVAFVLACPSQVIATPDSVHADLPLWTDSEDLEPSSFVDGSSFGCASPLRFGKRKLTYFAEGESQSDYIPDPEWLEIYNYGVFHCAYGFRWADDAESLSTASAKLGYFINLGAVKTERGEREIWLMQAGFRPGSDYYFFARPISDIATNSLEVLQVKCPKKYVRETDSLDIFGTNYCAINSKREIRRFAKRMAKLPPIGLMELVIEEETERAPD